MKRIPYLTISVVVSSLVLQFLGDAALSLVQWTESLWSVHEYWRLVTGHLVHWNWEHAFWDIAMFSVLGAVVELRDRRAIVWVLFPTALLTDLFLRITGEFETYRGLSGIDMGLFTYLLGSVAFEGKRGGDRFRIFVGVLGLVVVVGKIVLEVCLGRAVFVDTDTAEFSIATEAHLAGVLTGIGLLIGGWIRFRVSAIGVVGCCSLAVVDGAAGVSFQAQDRVEGVVLLHGLARTERSMAKMERALRDAGYQTLNIGYPSRSDTIENLSKGIRDRILSETRTWERIHFVTHSMGGIVVRQIQGSEPLSKIGRVVMLAPPSQGSELVDRLGGSRLYTWINGPAGRQLGTGSDALPSVLGPPDFECAVIAGNRSVNGILSLLIPGQDDGKVAVERTKLPGMKEYRVISASHPFIMKKREAIGLTLEFLEKGEFEENSNVP